MLTASADCDTEEEVDCVTTLADSCTTLSILSTLNFLTGTPVPWSMTLNKLDMTIFSPIKVKHHHPYILLCSPYCRTCSFHFDSTLYTWVGIGLQRSMLTLHTTTNRNMSVLHHTTCRKLIELKLEG